MIDLRHVPRESRRVGPTAQEVREREARLKGTSLVSFEVGEVEGWWLGELDRWRDLETSKVADRGGRAEWLGLFNADTGARVPARRVDVGGCARWVVLGGGGKTISLPYGCKPGVLALLGLVERRELAPAEVVVSSPRGTDTVYGLATTSARVVRSGDDWGRDGVPVDFDGAGDGRE